MVNSIHMWSTIRTLALGLWVGAMAGFAFLFAPIAFHALGPIPPFAATIAASVVAIAKIGTWCGVAAAAITLFARIDRARTAAAIIACIAIAIVFSAIETAWIVPAMTKTPLLTPAYETLHRQSSGVFGTALIAALVAWILASASRSRA